MLTPFKVSAVSCQLTVYTKFLTPSIEALAGKAIIDINLVVFQYEIYNALKGTTTNVTDVADDQTDWKSIARDTTLPENVRLSALQNNRNQKAAPTALRNLDEVFDVLIAS